MGRPKMEDNEVVSVRISKKLMNTLREISRLESYTTGKIVHTQNLIRIALEFVYEDNERMRECFRKSRYHSTKRFK